jgi:uncharacterized protein YgiM (DUF1202 family)
MARISRCFLALAFSMGVFTSLFAQEAIVKKDANLRVDPSTNEPPEATLHPGDTLTLLDPTPEHGYYQVRTRDGKEGWVFSRNIRVIASPSSSQPGVDPENPSVGGPPQCDDTLWNHVYHAHRLIVKQACLAVAGTIVDATNGKEPDGLRHEADGDTHGWLKLDPGHEDLLNAGNLNNEGGNLVFEVVCRFPVTQTDAKAACTNFTNSIKIPPVGSHVQIIGAYVRDTNHAQWMEIHPVTSIKVLP